MRRWLSSIAVCLAVAVLAPAVSGVPVAAAAGDPIINDCETNGQLTRVYTLAELRHALNTMPASIKEYTNCYDVISRAIIQARRSGTGKGGATGGSGGSFLPTPVIVILAVLIVAALSFGALALRRRRSGGGTSSSGGPGPPGPDSSQA